jgi:FkbM family methyltransferase
MMLTFLDVGAYHGERTIEAQELGIFKDIHALEPSPEAFEKLVENVPTTFEDENPTNVFLYNAGLWNKEGRFPLYRCGSEGGTLFKGKAHFGDSSYTKNIQPCRFIRASSFLKTLPNGNEFVIKLNCEGAECDIINDILPFAARIRCMCIDFDCLKIPEKAEELAETIKNLTLCQIPFVEMSYLTTDNRIKTLADIFLREYQ